MGYNREATHCNDYTQGNEYAASTDANCAYQLSCRECPGAYCYTIRVCRECEV
jgi:hypothetical protein